MEMKDKRAGKYAQNMRGGIKVRYTENSSEGLAFLCPTKKTDIGTQPSCNRQ